MGGRPRVEIPVACALVIASCVSAPPQGAQTSGAPSLAATAVPAAQATASGAGGIAVSPPPIPALPQPPQSAAVSERSRAAPRGEPFDTPPDLNKIGFSAADAKGMVHVTGQPGAVPGRYAVYVDSLQAGVRARVFSAADGSFQADVLAPDGSSLAIGYGDAGLAAQVGLNSDDWKSPALELTVNPRRPASQTEIPFTTGQATVGILGPGQRPEDIHWTASGTLNGWSFQPGNIIQIAATFVFAHARNVAGLDLRLMVLPEVSLARITDADGHPVQANYLPTLMTVTGLPVFFDDQYGVPPPAPERPGPPSAAGDRSWRFSSQQKEIHQKGDTISLTASFSETVPRDMPSGYYVARIVWTPDAVWRAGPDRPPPGPSSFPRLSDLPVIRVGDAKEPRFPWTLLGNTLSNGTRGGVAREDKGSFDLGTKVTFNADKLILPRDDARTGRPAAYRLEPFLPTVGNGLGHTWLVRTLPPLVSFVFPSGELHVSVERPDGKVDDLGRSAFRTGRTTQVYGADRAEGGPPFGFSSTESLLELSTLDPAFEYAFPGYGHFAVKMEGWIADATGITYRGGGTYDVYVAKLLDLDLGTFLGTPFEVGDTMSPVVHVRPGVPADVSVDLSLYPNSSAKDKIARHVSGKADHFGYFHPGATAQALKLSAPGEYVIDVTASYTDASGVLWMGALRGASVVETPNTSLVAHGRRGVHDDSRQVTSFPVWFSERNIVPPGSSGEDGEPQLHLPYNTGDITWAAKAHGAIFPELSLQDDRRITKLDRTGVAQTDRGPQAVDVGATGEIEVKTPDLVVGRGGGATTTLFPAEYPELVKTWAYYYISVQRPGVTVRSLVASGRADRAYWNFQESYNDQLGVQRSVGDLPGDIKLQYGGIVYRDASGSAQYAVYGSMAVMIDAGTAAGQRTFPPFEGGAGGPSGGPILTIDGRPIDIFFTPVGVMPGDVLEVGDTFAFSGALWPTLPSKVQVTVTSPDGTARSFSERGNKIGHVYDAANDLVLRAPGRYTVRVTVTHDGLTSAGPVQPPFPTGGILGSPEGTYSFYVVPKGNYLAIDTPAEGRTRRDGSPFAISARLPASLASATVHYTTDLTGTLLETGSLPLAGGSARYEYFEGGLARRFPNLDGRQGAPGDTVVVTLAAVGKDASGQDTAYARQVLFQGQQVYALAEP